MSGINALCMMRILGCHRLVQSLALFKILFQGSFGAHNFLSVVELAAMIKNVCTRNVNCAVFFRITNFEILFKIVKEILIYEKNNC